MKNKQGIVKKHKKDLLKVLLAASSDPTLLDSFLSDLLTENEYQELMLRWQIVKQLTDGVPQRKIANDLGVGIATVSRGSKEINKRKGGFSTMAIDVKKI